MQKNVAGQKIGAQLVSATDGSAFTGSVTVSVTGDAGTQATGSVGSGACTHEGNGYHTYAPAQAETNYDLIAFTFTGTGAVPVTVQIYTRHDANLTHSAGTAVTSSGGRPEVNATHIAGSAISQSGGVANVNVIQISGDSAAADNLESYTDGTTPMPVNATQISGDSTAADNLEAAADGSGYNLGGGQVVAASVTGAVGSVTGNVGGNVAGSVGSVTGNVGGNVAGSVGSVTGNVGGNVTGSIGSLAAQAKADVNAEVDSALDTAIPGTPTSNSINERVKTLDDAYTATRAGYLDNINNAALATTQAQTGDSFARLGAPAGVSVSADIAAVKSDSGGLVTNLATLAAKFTGITLLAEWLGLIAGKQTGNTTARTELRATGAGSGSYDETTDSLQAIRDRGDAAWGGGGGGGGTTVVVTPTVGVVTPDTTATEIHCKVGATNPKTVAVIDANGDPVDLTTFGDLVLCIETMKHVDVEIIEDAGITISGDDDNLFTFTPGEATVANERTLLWSLRRAADNYVILDGPLVVDYSALADS